MSHGLGWLFVEKYEWRKRFHPLLPLLPSHTARLPPFLCLSVSPSFPVPLAYTLSLSLSHTYSHSDATTGPVPWHLRAVCIRVTVCNYVFLAAGHLELSQHSKQVKRPLHCWLQIWLATKVLWGHDQLWIKKTIREGMQKDSQSKTSPVMETPSLVDRFSTKIAIPMDQSHRPMWCSLALWGFTQGGLSVSLLLEPKTLFGDPW